MRTIRNILLGLVAFIIGITAIQAENMNANKNRKSNNGWSSIGPSNIFGRVLAVHVDINNSQKIYAGTAGSGLWMTINGGASWDRCRGYTGSAAVSALAQGNDGRLFIGTGEGTGVKTNLEDYGIAGDGIYTSDDGGMTFSLITSTSSWRIIHSMVYDKKNNKLYVATSSGLQVSGDNGNTFVDAISNLTIFDVKVGNDGTVICAVQGDARVSTDNGNTFHSVCGTSNTQIPNDAGRISVGIAPSNSNVMYVFAANSDGLFHGVYVSNNKGETWKKIFKEGGYDDPMQGYGSLASAVAVSPTDPEKVLIGCRRLYEILTVTLADSTTKEYGRVPRDNSIIGNVSLIHSIAYTGKVIYLGTSSGIFYSTDGGQIFHSGSRYLSNLQIYSMSVGYDGRIIAGTRGNGSIYIGKPDKADATAITLRYGNGMGGHVTSSGNGGKSVFSLLKPEALFYLSSYGVGYRQASIASDPQLPSQWYGKTNSLIGDLQYPFWYPSVNELTTIRVYDINPIASPFTIWESTTDFNSKDTVIYLADKNYAPGEAICVKSKRNRYPIWITNTTSDTLYLKDTLRVHDVVTSRLFLGGGPYKRAGASYNVVGAPVFMSLTALNYDGAQQWVCVFRTKDGTEQVIDLVVSNDGDHLFVLTEKITTEECFIYRVSGFDQYRDPMELRIDDPDKGLYVDNVLRRLVDDTLVSSQSGEKILSIALDPQNNNNLIYTSNNAGGANNPRIRLITNALTATKSTVVNLDKEGTGIPTGMPVYTSIIEMTHPDIAYAGTERGIYKTENLTSTTPAWTLYNDGIDISVPVFQLFQQTKNFPSTRSAIYEGTNVPTIIDYPGVSNYGVIYAATHGSGIFRDTTYWQKTGIKNPDFGTKYVNNTLKVYPNPANSYFTIDYTTLPNEQVQLSVVDITGKIIHTKNLGIKDAGNYSERLDCSNLPNGFYFVNMRIGQYNKTAKIVISK
jgi:hypothetical protein